MYFHLEILTNSLSEILSDDEEGYSGISTRVSKWKTEDDQIHTDSANILINRTLPSYARAIGQNHSKKKRYISLFQPTNLSDSTEADVDEKSTSITNSHHGPEKNTVQQENQRIVHKK